MAGASPRGHAARRCPEGHPKSGCAPRSAGVRGSRQIAEQCSYATLPRAAIGAGSATHRMQHSAGASNTSNTLLDIVGAREDSDQVMCTHRCQEYAVHCSQLQLLLDLQCKDGEPISRMNTATGAECAACCARRQQARQPRLTWSRNCAQVKSSGTGTATFLQQ